MMEGGISMACKAWEERDRQMMEKGYIAGCKDALIDAIMFMISNGISKEDIINEYSESDYNEALAKLESEK